MDSMKGAAFTKFCDKSGFCEGSCLHKVDSVKGAAFTKWIL